VVSIFTLQNKEASFFEYIANLTMIHEYMQIKHVDGSYWTLTLELAFYFWMFLIFSTNQIHNIEKWLISWLISWLIIAIIFTLPSFYMIISPLIQKFLLLEYIQFFAAGICFFKIWIKQQNNKTYLILLLCFIANIIEYSVKGIGVLAVIHILFYLAISKNLKFLTLKIFTQLGAISYSLYLIHQNIGYVIIREFYKNNIPPYWGIFIALLTSVFLAFVLTYFVEKPSLSYLRPLLKNKN
jgi:peptidoglycan/LPS O-acetylase OafA/YrhL